MDSANGHGQSLRVAQACGRISVQVPCTVDEALVLLTERARVSSQTVDAIAAAVLDGSLRFDDDDG